MSDPDLIDEIIEAVSIPVMAKARIGHFVEAQIPGGPLGVDYIDESEVLSPADYVHHINKQNFKVPSPVAPRTRRRALRRITEGAAMIRSKGEAGTGDVSEAITHIRIRSEIAKLAVLSEDDFFVEAKNLQVSVRAGQAGGCRGELPVVLFVAGGGRHPGRRRTCSPVGCRRRLRRVRHLQVRQPGRSLGPSFIVEGHHSISTTRGARMRLARTRRGHGGINVADLPAPHRLAERGW